MLWWKGKSIIASPPGPHTALVIHSYMHTTKSKTQARHGTAGHGTRLGEVEGDQVAEVERLGGGPAPRVEVELGALCVFFWGGVGVCWLVG